MKENRNMDRPFEFDIPTGETPIHVTLNPGNSAIFVGANGGGKTRLAVFIEDHIKEEAHRISAHRSLTLNPDVPKIPEDKARSGLKFGLGYDTPNIKTRRHGRWGGKATTHLLDDYDLLLQALFAEQSNTALIAYDANKPGAKSPTQPFKSHKFDLLKDIWGRLLPLRQLVITADNISVQSLSGSKTYGASEMSDGERAIFYMIGQVLVADDNQLLIIDEPELHVHPSIMSKLWDELEAERADCAFVYITHDLEFATNRKAQKFVISDYDPLPKWKIEAVPVDTGFSEEVTTLILGSRRPILFVEGNKTSLDISIYRACYPDWTVIPRSSCSEVIHSVVSMRKNASLTRVTCSGIVDGDDYNQDDKNKLAELGIQVLPVSEIENLLLLPTVTAAIAGHEGYKSPEAKEKANELAEAIFDTLDTDPKIEDVVVEYCKRRIDRALKKVDLSGSSDLAGLQECYRLATCEIDISAIASKRTQEIENAIKTRDLPKLLEYYANKGLVALASRHLRKQKKIDFEEWIVRSLRNDKCTKLKDSLKTLLPEITPS